MISKTFFVHLQVVGNLIYYRYMNPAIVAPDAFDIVSFGVDKSLTADQVQSILMLDFISSLFKPTIISWPRTDYLALIPNTICTWTLF